MLRLSTEYSSDRSDANSDRPEPEQTDAPSLERGQRPGQAGHLEHHAVSRYLVTDGLSHWGSHSVVESVYIVMTFPFVEIRAAIT